MAVRDDDGSRASRQRAERSEPEEHHTASSTPEQVVEKMRARVIFVKVKNRVNSVMQVTSGTN